MKKYLVLFLLTISTFLTAQEEWSEETVSKWQIGQGNIAFGTSLSFINVTSERSSDNYVNFIGIGTSAYTGNNWEQYYRIMRKIVDFGIFSASSNGTYLAYGLSNNTMLYISTDIALFGRSDDDYDAHYLGNNITMSYVYSNLINKNFNINIAPYISVPFISMFKGEDDDNYTTFNFEQPVIIGFNVVGSIKSNTVFVDVMFNYSINPETEFEYKKGDYEQETTIISFRAYSFAFYLGNEFSESFSAKAGLLISSLTGEDHTEDGQIFQAVLENKTASGLKMAVVFEYGMDSGFYGRFKPISLIGKMELVF